MWTVGDRAIADATNLEDDASGFLLKCHAFKLQNSDEMDDVMPHTVQVLDRPKLVPCPHPIPARSVWEIQQVI